MRLCGRLSTLSESEFLHHHWKSCRCPQLGEVARMLNAFVSGQFRSILQSLLAVIPQIMTYFVLFINMGAVHKSLTNSSTGHPILHVLLGQDASVERRLRNMEVIPSTVCVFWAPFNTFCIWVSSTPIIVAHTWVKWPTKLQCSGTDRNKNPLGMET